MRARAVIFLALWTAGAPIVHAADPAADIEAQYQSALAVLKQPQVTGILVTEVQPESAAAGAGMRAGDVLVEYYGTRVATLRALREQVAEAVARRMEDPTAGGRVLARVRRGSNEIVLQLPREPLGIRAIEVEAGVPGPRNVPPNMRGTLTLNWKQVAATLAAEKEPVAFRLLERVEFAPNAGDGAESVAEEQWVGWQVWTLSPEGETGLSGTLDLYRLDATMPAREEQPLPTDHATFSFHLMLGDYAVSPAFVLDAFAARYAAAAGQEPAQVVATGRRLGERLQTTVALAHSGKGTDGPPGAARQQENAAALDALPQTAVPWVAAALPHEAGAALGLRLLSLRDFLARPGYVLVTRGRQPLPADPNAAASPTAGAAEVLPPAARAWQVDLMHMGVVVESYWYTDQCRVICMQTHGIPPLIARRVDSVKTASAPLERKAAARQPQTAPTSRPASIIPSGAL